jgi:hypothetical protein
MAHPLSDFEKYIGTPVQQFIIPIIPAKNADGTPTTLRPSSGLSQDHLGKIPGLWYEDGWTGFGGWQNSRAKATVLKRWQEWQTKTGVAIPVGFITADVHAGDVDCNKQEQVDQIVAILSEHLGASMVVRCREGSTRLVLFCKHKDNTAPIRKFRIAWVDKEGDKSAFEFLAGGQQVVAEGPHAKGAMHGWLHGVGLVEGYGQLPVVTLEMVIACFSALAKWVEEEGFTLDKLALPSSSDHTAAVSISNLMSPHLVRGGDTSMLTKALDHIELDDPRFDYDTFITLLRAICAACGGDMTYFAEVVWPWVCKKQTIARGQGPRTEEQGIEWLEERWKSFSDSQLGAEYVYNWASTFGFADSDEVAR